MSWSLQQFCFGCAALVAKDEGGSRLSWPFAIGFGNALRDELQPSCKRTNDRSSKILQVALCSRKHELPVARRI